ncbi:spermidine synthase [Hoeflea sp. TYP-13]|uniref:spermidine synthase n=1 Tax=Hoeflea sp. TYP-13 TaxID=3230023 RepID=UPI0034C5D49C
MSKYFEEIDYCPTPIGAVSLRRRHLLSLGVDVFEIMLGDEHLMSSLFTASEVALARLGLAELTGEGLDVVVGGLGLGYTAGAVLENEAVRSLTVVEMLEPVIRWHEEELVPLKPALKEDPRCRIIQGDFFALAASSGGFDLDTPGRKYHAILIDIDHTPDHLLDQRSDGFYSNEGLERLAAHLHPGGVMGLWSDAKTDDAFTERLGSVFEAARAEPVTFPNPLQDNRPFTQTVYLARKPA